VALAGIIEQRRASSMWKHGDRVEIVTEEPILCNGRYSAVTGELGTIQGVYFDTHVDVRLDRVKVYKDMAWQPAVVYVSVDDVKPA
jgi:hypothetical protein